MGDDYAALRPVQNYGFLGAQINWYMRWTGRFSYTFLYSLLGLLGPATPRFMPGLILTLWFAATVWAVRQIKPLTGSVSAPRVVSLSALIIFATLETAPNVVQSLYWQTAALTHVMPFIPLSLYVGLVGRGVNNMPKLFWRRFYIAGAGVLTFVGGGLGDAYTVFQCSGLILSILVLQVFAGAELKSRIRPLLLAGLIGSLLALTIVMASPGNTIREAFFPKQHSRLSLVGITIWYSVGFAKRLVFAHPVIFLSLLTLPLLMVLRDFCVGKKSCWDHQICIRLLWITPVAVLLLIICCTGAGFYAISVMLPERAQILLSLTFVCGTLLWRRAAVDFSPS